MSYLALKDNFEYKLKITYRKKISGLTEHFEIKNLSYEEKLTNFDVLLRDARQILENFQNDNAIQQIEIRKREILIRNTWFEFNEKGWKRNPAQKIHPPENYR